MESFLKALSVKSCLTLTEVSYSGALRVCQCRNCFRDFLRTIPLPSDSPVCSYGTENTPDIEDYCFIRVLFCLKMCKWILF